MNILLVEPDYRSKFPPLGLMRISTLHKTLGDSVSFVRGKEPQFREAHWHRIYVSSLYTYELPRTVATIDYYGHSVAEPAKDVIVGGIGATLLPSYVTSRTQCRVVTGLLDGPDRLGLSEPPVSQMVPDYGMMASVSWPYQPNDAYFTRASRGCIRNCGFCAVPKLEPEFGYMQSIQEQVRTARETYGERKDLVVLDNNILALDRFAETVCEIEASGFGRGEKIGGRLRFVDFNQGIDARLVSPHSAELLYRIAVRPIRLAFDSDGMDADYRRAVQLLASAGFREFTTYVMYNFADTPASFYRRLRMNVELSAQHKVSISGFPMRYIPVSDTSRGYVSRQWTWRWLRGVQCILNATHGMVSPSQAFFDAAFGGSCDEFLSIISMPDRYILHRDIYADEAAEWRRLYNALLPSEQHDFLAALELANHARKRRGSIPPSQYSALMRHYYPPNE